MYNVCTIVQLCIRVCVCVCVHVCVSREGELGYLSFSSSDCSTSVFISSNDCACSDQRINNVQLVQAGHAVYIPC